MKGQLDYHRFTRKMNLDKSIHTLEGVLKGIALDSTISKGEIQALRCWLDEHADVAKQHPFNEITPKLIAALEDGVLDEEEHADLLWLCGNLKSESLYYDALTSDIQRLHGLLCGILVDGEVTDGEIQQLSQWMLANEHLKGCYPFDEIDSILTSVLADKKIENTERSQLRSFFSEFSPSSAAVPVSGDGAKSISISGICAVCPAIAFGNKSFCLTGESRKATRNEITEKIKMAGGMVIDAIRQDLDYLIICAGANPCWAFACYGRKVEKAVEYRKKGMRIVIAHESDLWDAFADQGI